MIWCLIPLSTIFHYIVAVSFIDEGNQRTRRKPPTCRKVTDKVYHIMLHRVHLVRTRFELPMLVVIATDCIGSCNSNYHMIKTQTVPMSEHFQNLKGKWYRNRNRKSIPPSHIYMTANFSSFVQTLH